MSLPGTKKNVAVTEVGDELLLYDNGTDRAHCLSSIGKTVFSACRAEQSRAECLAQLTAQGVPDPVVTLDQTLRQLASEGLVISDSLESTFDRRKFLAAAGAAASIPLLMSVAAPRPAQALSCFDCAVVSGTAQPVNCLGCGRDCPASGCDGSAQCMFEYQMEAPVSIAATTPCLNFHAANVGGNYACKNGRDFVGYTKNLTFRADCQVARSFVLSQAGSHNSETYYCCYCDGTKASYSCIPGQA